MLCIAAFSFSAFLSDHKHKRQSVAKKIDSKIYSLFISHVKPVFIFYSPAKIISVYFYLDTKLTQIGVCSNKSGAKTR